MYIYIYVCVCVCVWIATLKSCDTTKSVDVNIYTPSPRELSFRMGNFRQPHRRKCKSSSYKLSTPIAYEPVYKCI